MQTNNISFRANQQEINSIQKACVNLSKTRDFGFQKVEPVDIAQIGTKGYLSKVQDGKHFYINVELKNELGAKAGTMILADELTTNNKVLLNKKTINQITDAVDSLKSFIKKLSEREVYTD